MRDADGDPRAYPWGHLVSPIVFVNGGTKWHDIPAVSESIQVAFRGRGGALHLWVYVLFRKRSLYKV
jgi:hypothetical protein